MSARKRAAGVRRFLTVNLAPQDSRERFRLSFARDIRPKIDLGPLSCAGSGLRPCRLVPWWGSRAPGLLGDLEFARGIRLRASLPPPVHREQSGRVARQRVHHSRARRPHSRWEAAEQRNLLRMRRESGPDFVWHCRLKARVLIPRRRVLDVGQRPYFAAQIGRSAMPRSRIAEDRRTRGRAD